MGAKNTNNNISLHDISITQITCKASTERNSTLHSSQENEWSSESACSGNELEAQYVLPYAIVSWNCFSVWIWWCSFRSKIVWNIFEQVPHVYANFLVCSQEWARRWTTVGNHFLHLEQKYWCLLAWARRCCCKLIRSGNFSLQISHSKALTRITESVAVKLFSTEQSICDGSGAAFWPGNRLTLYFFIQK